MNTRPAFLAAVPLAVMALLSGCSDLGPDENQLAKDIALHREIWEGKRPSAYTYEVLRGCNCSEEGQGPVWVRVQGTTVLSRVYSASGEPVPSTLAGVFPSVDGLFDLLEEAVRVDAWSISVSWHPERGYPISLFVDYEGSSINDEVGYTIVTAPAADTGS